MKYHSETQQYEEAQKTKDVIQHLENARITQTLMTAIKKII